MEHGSAFLAQAIMYLSAAVLAVVMSQRVGLGSVTGYLLAGIALGPAGFKLVGQVDDVQTFAELGVVFLMFVIGLELEPRRLWNMRMRLITLGLAQVVGSIVIITGAGWLLGFGVKTGIVAGMALALSSTALALQPLQDRGGLQSQGGQATFSVLLFQDLAVIPMLAIIPLLGGMAGQTKFSWQDLGFAVGVIVYTLVGGPYLVRPVFRHIARTRLREVFTAFALFVVIGIAWTFEHAGLSMALGTFLAGVLLAESEYRHEIEAAIEPFKGLLLGLFFISVGMSVDFSMLFTKPLFVIALIAGLFLLKGIVLWLIARFTRLQAQESALFILLLAQGGEFAFVLLGLGAQYRALPQELAQGITLAVALSMLLTPLLLAIHDRWVSPRLARDDAAVPADAPEAGEVIVAGLGRVGQVVARLLHASGFEPTILDDDPDHVEQSRKFGFRVFYGDATRLDLLEAAGAGSARYLIVALDDPTAITSLVKAARRHFPNLRIISRARDMRHMFELQDLGVADIERETFRSALALGEAALAAVTGDRARARYVVERFAEHDREVVEKLYVVHRDQQDSHVSVSNELRDQFARTLTQDEADAVSVRLKTVITTADELAGKSPEAASVTEKSL